MSGGCGSVDRAGGPLTRGSVVWSQSPPVRMPKSLWARRWNPKFKCEGRAIEKHRKCGQTCSTMFAKENLDFQKVGGLVEDRYEENIWLHLCSAWQFASHSAMHSTGLTIRSNLEFGVLPKDPSTCKQEEVKREFNLITLHVAHHQGVFFFLTFWKVVPWKVSLLNNTVPHITLGIGIGHHSVLQTLGWFQKK